MRISNLVFILLLLSVFLLQFTSYVTAFNIDVNRKTADQHIIHISYMTKLKWRYKQKLHKMFIKAKYNYYAFQTEGYFYLLTMYDTAKRVYASLVQKRAPFFQNHEKATKATTMYMETTARAVAGYPQTIIAATDHDTDSVTMEDLSQRNAAKYINHLLSAWTLHQQRTARRIQVHWIDESVSIYNIVSQMLGRHHQQWTDLITTWNKPLLLPENRQPYHYHEDEDDQQLALLFLKHDVRLMKRNIDLLYKKQTEDITALHSPLCLSAQSLARIVKPEHHHLTKRGQWFYRHLCRHLDLIRTDSFIKTKRYMLQKLEAVHDDLMRKLGKSYEALEESIFVEKGPYYATLHPDNMYIIVLGDSERQNLLPKMKRLWMDRAYDTLQPAATTSYWWEGLADDLPTVIYRFWHRVLESIKKQGHKLYYLIISDYTPIIYLVLLFVFLLAL
ncbi:MAG: hypothetical protein EXX96DRAFT_567400 [Benjaminiella poitrasii]|nr:MAG: hypothetical protein EXX96DRAFT_567400 [Benjaminiella poitrasii]